jgi:hypothetical protein
MVGIERAVALHRAVTGSSVTAVTRGRLLRASLALVVAVGVQSAHGAPSRAIQSVRAVSCCATRCQHPMPARGASQCCRAAADEDTATLAPPSSLPHPAATWVVLPSASPAQRTVAASEAFRPLAHARGAPIFLLVRSLRI